MSRQLLSINQSLIKSPVIAPIRSALDGNGKLPGSILGVYQALNLAEADVTPFPYVPGIYDPEIVCYAHDVRIGTGQLYDRRIILMRPPGSGWELTADGFWNVTPIFAFYCYSHLLYTPVGWPYSISSKMKIIGPSKGYITLHNAGTVPPAHTQGSLYLDAPISTTAINISSGSYQEFQPIGADAPAGKARVYVYWAGATSTSQIPADPGDYPYSLFFLQTATLSLCNNDI